MLVFLSGGQPRPRCSNWNGIDMQEATSPPTSPKPTTFTAFMLVKASTTWLALPPPARFGFLGEVIIPILGRHPAVKMRFFDTEFYSADISDVIVWETQNLAQYQSVIDDLRETKFWGVYFEVVSILLGVENAYADHYGRVPVGAS
jgi:hypothetical protein